MIRTARGAIAVLASAALLTACVSVAVVPPTPTTEPTIDGGRWLDPRCAQLNADEEFAGLWTVAPETSSYDLYGAGSVWDMQGSALIQAGALICSWGSDRSSALVIAFGEGSEGFRRSEPSFEDPASGYVPVDRWDGSYVLCRSDGVPRCHWNVLAGETWLSVFLRAVPEADLRADDMATTPSAGVVAALVDRVAGVDLEPASLAPDSWSCASTLAPETVAEAFQVEESRVGASLGAPLEYALGRSTPDFGQTMWAYAQELVGYRECHLSVDGEQAASIVSAPGGSWLLDEPAIDPETLVNVADFGPGIDRCQTEGDFVLCTVAVTRGNNLVVVQIPVRSSEEVARSQAVALAAIILG